MSLFDVPQPILARGNHPYAADFAPISAASYANSNFCVNRCNRSPGAPCPKNGGKRNELHSR